MDPTRRLARVTARDHHGVGSDPGIADIAAILLAAEQIGAAARCLDLTVAYTKERVQFGRPIGSFQALKHRMADLYVAVQSARAVVDEAIDAPVAGVGGAGAPGGHRGVLHGGRRGDPDARRHRDHLGARHPAVLQARSRQRAAVRAGRGTNCAARDRGVLSLIPVSNHVALRAGIPPFYVMDVWLAAASASAATATWSTCRRASPAPARRSRCGPRPPRRCRPTSSATPWHWASPNFVRRSRGRMRTGTDWTSTADDVVVTTGSSGGFLLAFLACFDVGDRVAMASPGYPCYRNILSALGCEVVEIPCGPETRFQPTAQMLAELDPPVEGVIVASPANPTGTVIPPAELAAIASWCDETGVRLISDEVYHGLVYPGAPETSCAWQTSRNAVVVNSFSKYFAMTGWRLGLAAGARRTAPRGGLPDRQLHHLPAGAVAVRGGGGVHAGVDRRGRGTSASVRPEPGACC